jgi:NTE family protein
VDQQVNAPEAFALSRSVEYHNNTITAEALFKEVYEEGFRRSPLFSVSSSTGKRIMQSSTLHQELKDKNMFEVYTNRPSKVENGRTEKVFSELNALNSFKNKYESFVNAASKQEVDPSTTQTGNHK